MAYGEKYKYLVSGRMLGDSFLPDKTPDRKWHCPLSEPFPTQSHRAVNRVPHPELAKTFWVHVPVYSHCTAQQQLVSRSKTWNKKFSQA